MKTLLSTAAAVLLLTIAAPATGTAGDPRVANVAYDDLDLSQADGRATLDRRLRAAAREVCRDSGGDVAARLEALRCEKASIAAGRKAATDAASRAMQGARLADRR